MARHTSYFYLLLFSLFTVFIKVELISNATASPKDVSGFSLTEDEMKKFHIWRNGFIPYYIDVTSYSDKVLRDKIRSLLNMVNSITSLNFVELPSPPEDDHTRWVFFINRRGLLGCADHSVWNFTSEGVQRVVLGYDCMNKEGELPEAVLAIAGVPAQHTAPDRDEYIEVFEDNIIPDKRKLFEKLSNGDWLFHDLPYDYDSVGHYHNFKYSRNGKTVIQTRNLDVTIGETKVLSEIDIWKIRLLYNFITQKKILEASDCQKLFKTGSKFNSFVPNEIIVKPKQKPAKYTGVNPNKNIDIEYVDDEKASSEKQSVESDGDLKTGDIREESKATPAIINLSKLSASESDKEGNKQMKLAIEENKEKPGNNTKLSQSSSFKSEEEGNKQVNLIAIKKKQNPAKFQDLLSTLSDYHSGEIRQLKLKTNDPLEDLSDYSSNNEEMRKDRITVEKQETLKHIGWKLK